MKWGIWGDGRLSWLWTSLFVYTTFCVLAFDYAWRMIETPFELLVASATVLWLVGSVVVIRVGRRIDSRK